MPATTLTQMYTGKDVLSSSDLIQVLVTAVDAYLIKDHRITGEAEGTGLGWVSYDYDTARTTFNTNMADLS